MKTFKVIYTESLYHVFYVDAENEDQAREKFNQLAFGGKLDYSNGECYDSGIESVEEVAT